MNNYVITVDCVHSHNDSNDRACVVKRQMQDNIDSLNKFFMAIERRAYRITMMAIGNSDDALDIVQESMMKLAEKYASKTKSEWTPLFYRILQSKIRDWYRRNKVQNRWRVKNIGSWLGLGKSADEADEYDWVQGAADAETPTPERNLASENLAEALEWALKKLPLRQQQVFLLRAWEGLDVKSSAAAMNCSEGSVKTHYFRAIAKLRELLSAHEDVVSDRL